MESLERYTRAAMHTLLSLEALNDSVPVRDFAVALSVAFSMKRAYPNMPALQGLVATYFVSLAGGLVGLSAFMGIRPAWYVCVCVCVCICI